MIERNHRLDVLRHERAKSRSDRQRASFLIGAFVALTAFMLFRRFPEIHIQTEELKCDKEAATDGGDGHGSTWCGRHRCPTQSIASADNIDEHSSSVRGIPGPQRLPRQRRIKPAFGGAMFDPVPVREGEISSIRGLRAATAPKTQAAEGLP